MKSTGLVCDSAGCCVDSALELRDCELHVDALKVIDFDSDRAFLEVYLDLVFGMVFEACKIGEKNFAPLVGTL